MKNKTGFKHIINELWQELANRTTDLQDEISTCDFRLDRNHRMTQQQINTLSQSVMQLNEMVNMMIQKFPIHNMKEVRNDAA